MEETVLKLMEEMLHRMNVENFSVQVAHENGICSVAIDCPMPSMLIGYRGETLAALQHIVRMMAGKRLADDRVSIVLDVDGYRIQQEEQMKKMAERHVSYVRKFGTASILPPMAPYLRRAIHLHLAQEPFQDVVTESVGEGMNRKVVIKPK